MHRTLQLIGKILFILAIPGPALAAEPDADREKIRIASDISILLRSAHSAMSEFQDLINDPARGDKGVTGAVVADATRVNYEMGTGRHLEKSDSASSAGTAQRALMQSIHDVMGPAQALINEQGKGYKGFIPAVFVRLVAERFNESMRDRIVLKVTAPKAYIRNPVNTPDEWEDRIIETKLKSGDYKKGRPVAESVTYNGKPALRFMLPEYYSQSCLVCHGEPRGEFDMSGMPREGGKLGELGGVISTVVFK